MNQKYIRCEKCFAHYPKENSHTCDPFMARLVEYKSNQIHCLRCGIDKKDIRKEKLICKVYGTIYKKHLYK